MTKRGGKQMTPNHNLLSQTSIHDVAIIGGGPAGLSAAIYAARAGLNTVVLDKSPTAGALGITDKIENYPGILHAIAGKDLVSTFRQQAEHFGATVLQTQVYGVNFRQDPKEVLAMEDSYRAKTIIIATGAMGRKPTLSGEAELLGRGVSYCAVCDAAFYKNQEVAVIGESGEVLAELDLIAKFASKIYLFLRGKQPTLEQIKLLQDNPKIEWMLNYRLVKILGDGAVEGLVVAEENLKETVVNVKGVFVYLHGNSPIVDFLADAVELTPIGCIKVDKNDMSTSVEGVYAVGDITCKEIRQAVVAAAEGCTAALSADKYLNRRQKARSLWS
jgi:thioredoxin reductase (NADPH)